MGHEVVAILHIPFLPRWLFCADFRVAGGTAYEKEDRKYFFKHPVEPTGSYGMRYKSGKTESGKSGAFLVVGKLNPSLNFFGFLQGLSISDQECDMYLGNFSLKGGSTGLPVGTGVGLEESLNSPDFKLKAGHTADVSGGNEFTDGMSIQRDRDGYTVIIGDWKGKARGYFFAPLKGVAWRGGLPIAGGGPGDTVGLFDKTGKMTGWQINEKLEPTAAKVPVFQPLAPPTLFNKVFETKLD